MGLFRNRRAFFVHAWFAVVGCALTLRAEIEFTGYFGTPANMRFVLSDQESKRFSAWLMLGDTFAGFTLIDFDPHKDVLTVAAAGAKRELRLREARVQDGKLPVAGTLTLHGTTVAGVRAALFVGEESAFPLSPEVTLRIKPERRSDGNLLYASAFDVKRPDGTTETHKCPAIVARPGGSFEMRLGEFGFAFKP